jgi:hypothetical protein
MSMHDPRVPKGGVQTWPGVSVNPRVVQKTLMRLVWEELPCPSCRAGTLVSTGEAQQGGTLHACSRAGQCSARWIVPGNPFPRRVEELDSTSNLLRG